MHEVYIKTPGMMISFGGKKYKTPVRLIMNEQKLRVFTKILESQQFEYRVQEAPISKPVDRKKSAAKRTISGPSQSSIQLKFNI